MDLFVNELSLHGQFGTLTTFIDALKEIISCRSLAHTYSYPFYCLRTITEREALPGILFKDAVQQTRNRDFISMVRRWLDKHGPFWEDIQAHSPNEYFEHADQIVTDCALAEAAFRLAREQATVMVSFNSSRFCTTPLRIIWRQSDSVSYDVDLPNFWQQVTLAAYLKDREALPQSWTELVERAKTRYRRLTFVDGILDPLVGEPFSPTVADRVLVLLSILDRLKGCFVANATLNAEGHQLMQDFFQGERALFTDESDTNKRTFARQLTFRLPTGEDLFCPYHGKISFRYYRVHHSWPIRPEEPLYVAYIGPKITKN